MEILEPYREQIEELDRQLADMVARRLGICIEVAAVKKAEGIPMMQAERVESVCNAYSARGTELGISPVFMRRLAMLLIDEACRIEDEIIEK